MVVQSLRAAAVGGRSDRRPSRAKVYRVQMTLSVALVHAASDRIRQQLSNAENEFALQMLNVELH